MILDTLSENQRASELPCVEWEWRGSPGSESEAVYLIVVTRTVTVKGADGLNCFVKDGNRHDVAKHPFEGWGRRGLLVSACTRLLMSSPYSGDPVAPVAP
jgi:hypothetical protein